MPDAIPFVYDDGGREAAGYRGYAGDCGVRSVAIAAALPYQEVYDAINVHAQRERPRGGRFRSNARTGVNRATMKWYLEELGWHWTPTMGIGTGCTVHLRADELPMGRLIVSLSRHYAAVIDGVLHDNHDSSRDGMRCVYGIWTREKI
jgi:hypothetical protein